MKAILELACIYFAAAGAALAATPITITFDDLPDPGLAQRAPIPAGYAGLQWSANYLNAYDQGAPNPAWYQQGIVSPPNVAVNVIGFSSGTAFNVNSLYLTSALNDNIRVQVVASGDGIIYNNTYTITTLRPTRFDLNYLDVNEVDFAAPDPLWMMDSLTITFIPEPSSLALAGLGAAALAISRRRR